MLLQPQICQVFILLERHAKLPKLHLPWVSLVLPPSAVGGSLSLLFGNEKMNKVWLSIFMKNEGVGMELYSTSIVLPVYNHFPRIRSLP
jgi:hypothetical protein